MYVYVHMEYVLYYLCRAVAAAAARNGWSEELGERTAVGGARARHWTKTTARSVMAASVVDRGGGGGGSVGDQSVGDAAGRARIDSYSVVVVAAMG